MSKVRDLITIDELLAQDVLTSKERTELYKTARRRRVPVQRQRFDALMRQGCLFKDDITELQMLAEALGENVEIARHNLEE